MGSYNPRRLKKRKRRHSISGEWAKRVLRNTRVGERLNSWKERERIALKKATMEAITSFYSYITNYFMIIISLQITSLVCFVVLIKVGFLNFDAALIFSLAIFVSVVIPILIALILNESEETTSD